MKKAPIQKNKSNIVSTEHKLNNYQSLLSNFRLQSFFLALICFVFYANTFNNGYAVDDFLIITNNAAIKNGIKGIPEIINSDVFDSYYKKNNADTRLSGGRYRPLTLITYAIEQQIFGTVTDGNIDQDLNNDNTIIFVRHFDNVLLYALSMILLLYFLRKVIFPTQPFTALLTVLFFAIHPIHTEVVANIKSRDEILSLIFITLTFIYASAYQKKNKAFTLIKSLSCFLLALLSKEYAVTLLILIPMLFYVLNGYSLSKSIKTIFPYLGVFIVYLMIRYSVVSLNGNGTKNELLNNPYLLANPTQKIATELATLLNYLKLLIFPHPLSADYSYNQIPYKKWSNPLVWFSILLHSGLIIGMVDLFRKRHILSFAIALYLFNLILISNLFFDIGATMGERLIYHASLGFCMVVAYGINYLYQRFKNEKVITIGITISIFTIIMISGIKTISRNKDWESNQTLYLKDVQSVPNSSVANGNAGAAYNELANNPENTIQKNEFLNKAIIHFNKAIEIDPKYILAYINRGTSYFELGDLEKAKKDWDIAYQLNPTNPDLQGLYASYYTNTAISNYGNKGDYTHAIIALQKASVYNPTNTVIWYNMGYYYTMCQKDDSAIYAWQKIIDIAPNDPLATKCAESIKILKERKVHQ